MHRKWDECRKRSKNVIRLESYSFADSRKPTGCFHSHLCPWQYCFKGKIWLTSTEATSPYTADECSECRFIFIGRNAATRVHSNPGSSADQFDWEGRKINGNRKKTPRKCPFQGRNLKVTTPEEGRGKEKVETCSVAVPSEVGFFGVQWRSSPHNLDQNRGKIQFSTLLADLRRHLNTIPHLRSLLQVSHDPNPRKKRQLNNIGGSQAPQKCSSWPKT